MENDLTIAVVRGLPWAALRPYAVSLAQNFAGTKLVFLEQNLTDVREKFMQLGFTVVDRTTPPSELHPEMPPDWAYGVYRFLPAIEYLKQHPHFRYVLWTDVRDVIFQSNPFVWMERNLEPHRIAVAGLGHAIKDCPYNDPWVKACAPGDYDTIRQYEAVACGTFGGEAPAMLELFEDILEGCKAAHQPWATDQGMLNCLVRTPPYDKIVTVPRMSEAFTAQWFPAKNDDPIIYPGYGFPVFDKAKRAVFTEAGQLISVVHLYDRDAAWVAIMRQRYV